MINSPNLVHEDILKSGEAKINYSTKKVALLAILAGIFIAFGAVSSSYINVILKDSPFKSIFSAAAFTVGIVMVIILGAQLFTGSTILFARLINKTSSVGDVFLNLTKVYFFNFIGALFVALLVYFSHSSPELEEYIFHLAEKKLSLSPIVMLVRGILCNMLVVLGVVMSMASNTAGGKTIMVQMPVFTFVLLGYEHIVANMFYIPFAMLLGYQVSLIPLLTSIILVTIGNLAGGFIVIYLFTVSYNKNRAKI